MEDARIIETHVAKWMKSNDVLKNSKKRLEDHEWKAYTEIRGAFSKNHPNLEAVKNYCETLKGYLDGAEKDEVYTAVRDFVKTSEIAVDNMTLFKELLEDKGFFGQQSGGGQDNFEGQSMGTATYRRVEMDGNVYEGMFLGNECVWKGKINYENGSFYEGEWDKNGPKGEGMLTWENGRVFTGRFVGLSGNGRIVDDEETYYDGPWNENGPHGQGVWHQGERVDKGQYADGCRVGRGRMDWPNGDWYEGEWNDNGANGHGTTRVGNRTDEGQYRDGERVGTGTMKWDNGDWYRGEWNDNGMHGRGVQYISSCRRTDEGEWKDGESVGSVTMKWNNGDIYTGTWQYINGNLNGEGEMFTASTGNTRKGKWVDGNWKNDWGTPRNMISGFLWIAAVIAFFVSGFWAALGLGVVAYFVGEKD